MVRKREVWVSWSMGVREMRRWDSTCSLSSSGRRDQEENVDAGEEVEIGDRVRVEGIVGSAILRVGGEGSLRVVLVVEGAMM